MALSVGPGTAAAEAPECGEITYRDNRFAVCFIDLTSSDLRLFWRDAAGEPYTTIDALKRDLGRRGETLTVAMNAGMFDAANAPIGLYVEAGETLVAANTNEGPGNFHLLPNGVFYWGPAGAGVMETNRYLQERPAAAYATQSGPLLLIDWAVHPRFLPDSDSRKIRNGVGVIDPQHVVFVIAETTVTFHEFALFFRDRLGTPNALYLDGSLSALEGPGVSRGGYGRLGPILGVVE